MEGIKERLFQGVFFFASALSSLHAQSLENLENALVVARDLLDRVDNGKSPCFLETCRDEKKKLLHDIYREAQVLSFIDPDFEEAVDEGIFGGRRMTNSDFSFPLVEDQKNLRLADWFKFYERRYSDDLLSESRWLRLSNQVESLRFTMAKHMALSRRLSEEDKIYFQQIWERGYAEILGNYREAQIVSERRDRARLQNREQEAAALDKKMLELHLQARDLTERLGENIRDIQARIFPEMDMVLVTNFCLSLKTWLQFADTQDLFDPHLIQWMQRVDSALTHLQRLMRNFNDLEYGSVGLKNYLSLENPAIRIAHEHEIQVRLEEHLSNARFVINTGQSTFAMAIAVQLGGSSRLLQFGLIGLSNYLQDVLEFRFADRVLPRSPRLPQLEERYAYWEARMIKRKEELERTQVILEEKIRELEVRIHEIKTEGTYNGETSTL